MAAKKPGGGGTGGAGGALPRRAPKERERAVLEAAAAVFANHGYARATIDQIAAAAGVAKGTVYFYYSSKEDLFYALMEEFTRQSLADLGPLMAQADEPVLARIEALFLAVGRSLDAKEAMIPLTLEFWSASGVEDSRKRFGAAFASMFAEFRESLTALLQEGAAKGEVKKDAASEDIASCLMAMIDGLIIQQWTDPHIRLSATFKNALPVLLGALRP